LNDFFTHFQFYRLIIYVTRIYVNGATAIQHGHHKSAGRVYYTRVRYYVSVVVSGRKFCFYKMFIRFYLIFIRGGPSVSSTAARSAMDASAGGARRLSARLGVFDANRSSAGTSGLCDVS
jgi:hypothetical protein